MEIGWITAVLVITVYILVVIALWKTGWLEKLHISAFGPLLMWRTVRGLKALDRAARHDRFGRAYGNFSLGLMLLFMGLVSLILLWEVPLALKIPVSSAPGPEMIIGLPGINPLIPIGYGIVALAIAIIVHEFAHGVLLRVGKVVVKSAGLLLFVIPIGAFVEPDEEELKKISRRQRTRMYAAGPASNLILAVVCAGIFCWGFMGSVQPVEKGVMVTNVVKGYPADQAGLKPYSLITAITLSNNTTVDPTIDGEEKFLLVMSQAAACETVTIAYIYQGARHVVQTTLWNKWDYYQTYFSDSNKEEFKGRGFLGVGTMDAGILPRTLTHPVRYDSLEGFVGSIAYFIGLPFFGLQPMKAPVTDLYTVTGPLSGLPPDAFWVLANTFYWLFWLNLMVGATNCLPIPKVDGGMVFKDGLLAILQRLKPLWKEERREKFALAGYRITGLVIIFLIMWQFIGPRVGAML